jgi:Domain of unknown function (DUF4184)
MPLTFAHPAVALPLRKLLGRWGFLPALAIGSMAPDVPYFVPLGIDRHLGHSIPALLLGTFFGMRSIGTKLGVIALQQFLGNAITTGVAISIGVFLLYSWW